MWKRTPGKIYSQIGCKKVMKIKKLTQLNNYLLTASSLTFGLANKYRLAKIGMA